MSNETLKILTAPELIAINQDSLVIQAVVAAVSKTTTLTDATPILRFLSIRPVTA